MMAYCSFLSETFLSRLARFCASTSTALFTPYSYFWRRASVICGMVTSLNTRCDIRKLAVNNVPMLSRKMPHSTMIHILTFMDVLLPSIRIAHLFMPTGGNQPRNAGQAFRPKSRLTLKIGIFKVGAAFSLFLLSSSVVMLALSARGRRPCKGRPAADMQMPVCGRTYVFVGIIKIILSPSDKFFQCRFSVGKRGS